MRRRLVISVFLTVAGVFGQNPSFEVAAIRPADPEALQQGANPHLTIEKGRVEIGVLSLVALVANAWNLKPYQITGPDWLASLSFDISAKLPAGAKAEDVPLMLQGLLRERFGMKMHMETAEQPVYALTIGKSGFKVPARLEPLELPEGPMPAGTIASWSPLGTVQMTESANGSETAGRGFRMVQSRSGIHISASRFDVLAMFLSRFMGKPVLDETNLTGSYQIEIEIDTKRPQLPPDGLPPGPPVNPFLSAVEKFGLKLEPRKAQVEMLIVDHLEKTPAAN